MILPISGIAILATSSEPSDLALFLFLKFRQIS